MVFVVADDDEIAAEFVGAAPAVPRSQGLGGEEAIAVAGGVKIQEGSHRVTGHRHLLFIYRLYNIIELGHNEHTTVRLHNCNAQFRLYIVNILAYLVLSL